MYIRGSASGGGGLHPGEGVCIQGRGSASGGGGLHPGVSASRGSASRGVCIQGVCIQGCLHPGWVCIQGGSVSRVGLYPGGLHPGKGICIQGGSVSRGVCIQEVCIWGSASRGVCIHRDLHLGVCIQGGLYPQGSASRWVGQTSGHVTCDACWEAKPLPPVDRITDTCENITLPQTSFVGAYYEPQEIF